MKKIKFKYQNIKQILSLFLLASLFSCETIETDLTDNPSQLGINDIETNGIFVSSQLQFAGIFEAFSTFGMDVSRMTQMGGSSNYSTNYIPASFNGTWTAAYAGFLKDSQAAKQLAREDGNSHAEAALEIMEAYTLMTLVDYFGDVPFTEALDSANVNPVSDDDASIYDAAFTLLNDAISKLNGDSLPLNNLDDFFYNGNEENWKRLANSLLIKYAITTRLVDADNSRSIINGVIASGDYISNSNSDFVFNWSTNTEFNDNRHPKFTLGYDNPTPAGFQSNYFMWLLNTEKGLVQSGLKDPRLRYYFYRKTLEATTDQQAVTCVTQSPPSHYNVSNYPFCQVGEGYIGRDHGNDGAILVDGSIRTIMGLYPSGGKFDDDSALSNPGMNEGAAGAGISPILTSSFVDFMIAEAQLTLNSNTAAAKSSLLSGIEKSIDDVLSFNPGAVDSNFAPSSTDISDYISFVDSQYDNSPNKLNVIIKEYFIALWGNGVEAYNNYRRTGLPENIQPSLNPNAGSYVNLMFYPDVHITLNSNATQRQISQKVFWAEPTSFNLDF